MAGAGTCPQCGAALPDEGWEGLCPKCLVRVSLETSAVSDAGPELLRRFGDYELLEEIARGGMGVVYKARQVSLNRTVALKMILAGQLASAADVQRFRAEAESAARLQHPNIVAIHEIGRHDGQHYFSMDYVEGQNLAQLVGQKPLPPKQASKYLRTVAEAIQYAHQQGILHRDLKPSNILIDQSGQPRVTDFGLAKQMKGDSELTVSGQVLGSPNFMPPEQAAGKRTGIGPAADIYALGAILYFTLTGRPPFAAESLAETLRQVANVEPPAPQLLNPSVPRDVETICLKCLAKEPQRRYTSAKELADELERFIEDKPIFARPSNRIEKTWRWCRRNPMMASLAGVTVVLLLAEVIGSRIASMRIAQENKQATERLWESYLAQAEALRFSGRVGRRFNSLDVLKKAANIRPSIELRNEAIACMALTDVDLSTNGALYCPSRVDYQFAPMLDRYVAIRYQESKITVHRAVDQVELTGIPISLGEAASDTGFSPDGRYFALVASPADSAITALTVFDLTAGKMVLRRSSEFGVRAIDFSPMSSLIAVVYSQGQATRPPPVEILDLSSGEVVTTLEEKVEAAKARFDPGGGRIAICSEASTNLLIQSSKTGKAIQSLPHRAPVSNMAWRSDGVLLVTACNDKRLYVWQPETETLRNVLQGSQSEITSIVFNHAGDRIVACGWDSTTRLWDPLGGEPPLSMPGMFDRFSPDDLRLVCSPKASQIIFAEVSSGRECRLLHSDLEPSLGPRGCDFSPDGRWVASAHSDGVRLWDPASSKELTLLPLGNTWTVVFHPDGGSFFTSGAAGLKQWPLSFRQDGENHELQIGPPSELTRSSFCARAALDRKGRILAFIDGEAIRIFDLPARKERSPRAASAPRFLALDPNGRWWALGTRQNRGDGQVRDMETDQVLQVLPDAARTAMSVSPDGKWLAACGLKECRFWDASSWRFMHTLPREAESVQVAVAFAPDNGMAAVAWSPTKVRLLALPSFRELATLEPPAPHFLSWLCFSPDGSRLAAAGETKQIQLWDLRLIRKQLAAMKLDWDAPPLPPVANQFHGPVAVTILGATNASTSLKAN